eukprot:2692476-Amphidinium_carterae.4
MLPQRGPFSVLGEAYTNAASLGKQWNNYNNNYNARGASKKGGEVYSIQENVDYDYNNKGWYPEMDCSQYQPASDEQQSQQLITAIGHTIATATAIHGNAV